MPLNKDILMPYKKRIFIETGTQIGNGIDTAMYVGFEEIWSIEANIELYAKCRERFKDNPKVKIIGGDARERFPILMKRIDEPATIWLDAHGPQLSTLIEELKALGEHEIKTHTIMIDDIRLFKEHYWKDLPIYDGIVELIKGINPDYKIELIDSTHFKEDILVAKI